MFLHVHSFRSHKRWLVPVAIIDNSMYGSANKIEVGNSVGLDELTCEFVFQFIATKHTG